MKKPLAILLLLLALPLSFLDAAAPTVAARTWWQSSNTISNVYGSVPSPGGTNQGSVTASWSGGAYNDSAEWLIVWGGGHGDYSGNEFYVFDLDSTTPAWRREKDHYGTIDNNEAGEATCLYTGDAQAPRSRHTYNYLQWMGNVNRFISAGCKDPAVGALQSPAKVQAYDFVAKTWSARANNLHTTTLSNHSTTAYDRQTGFLWFNGVGSGGRMTRYNYNTDAWTDQGDESNNSGQTANCSTCDIDTSFTPNRKYCTGSCSGAGTGRTVYYILDTTDTDIDSTRTNSTGPKKCEDTIRPGFVWSTRDTLFVAWCGDGTGNDSVYTFNPRTNAWAGVGPAGGNTVTPNNQLANGTFGRWRYSPRYGLFILQNATTGSAYVYRLSDTAAAGGGATGHKKFPLLGVGGG